MVPATPMGIPMVAEASADPLVRVLSWTYRREDETVRCRLALTVDCSTYASKIQPPLNPARASIELFNDALSAFDRQTATERALINAGFALERFDSSSEPR
jgi:hypothetical protein